MPKKQRSIESDLAHFSLDPLSKNFVIAKPVQQQSYDEKIIYEIEKRGDLIIERKGDGYKIFGTKKENIVRLYTDGINEIDERFDHIKKEFASTIPNNSMTIGEATAYFDQSKDDIGYVGSIVKSKTQRAIETQHQNGFLKYMLFGVVLYDNQPIINEPYWRQLGIISDIISKKTTLGHILPPKILSCSYDEAKELVKKNEWEGLVLYDRNFISSFRLDGGDPQRVKGCYKWKPLGEDDFIVRELIPSEKDPKRLKEIVLLQIDPATGKEFYCGKFGHFTDEKRKEIQNLKRPFVIQIEFESRFPKSGKVRNGMQCIRIRDDKKIKDCIAPKNYPAVEYTEK